ncbi:MAG: twin-arginine translocase subunit TatB [Alphaproteobacteria bacterium]|nr:twin-arginine translocase subunit TatB [Alphaproteobacteria bacterium]MBV9062770.1 twin-arginine translocase subunit TatB [Alphaproteobacteria bacterium]
MIDLSWSHILIVLVVALVVVGPKDLPRLMHTLGRWMAKARAMADQFRRSFDEMSRQAELDELRAEIQALRNERPFAGIEQALHEPVMPPLETRHGDVPALAPPEPEPVDTASAQPILPSAEPPPT